MLNQPMKFMRWIRLRTEGEGGSMRLKNPKGLLAAAVVFGAMVARPARAQFGGSQMVFDPSVFGRQLEQLQQETATVTNLAQQLQYMIRNTTGGGAGVWRSNQDFLANLGDIINQQEGLSYTAEGLAQQFQQIYPGYNGATAAGVQSPRASADATLNTLNGALASAQGQAQDFQTEQATLQALELKNQTAAGRLQAIQAGNEIALAQVQQIQLLRQLVMAEINSRNVAAANQLNNQVQSSLEAQAFFAAPPSRGLPDLLHASPAPPPQ
jgi:P-type conjugative transfer protein TrbJ